MVKIGKLGEQLNDSSKVIRVGQDAIQSDYTKVSEKQFVLSSHEKLQDWKRISVFEASLTTAEQALQMTSDKRSFLIQLKVEGIRSIKFNEEFPFDVKWDPLERCIDGNGNKIQGSPDGCEGHAGLDGLHNNNSTIRRSLRVRLAKYATIHGELSINNS